MLANTHHIDGKCHVPTVPVKLYHQQSNQRKPHTEAHFAVASVMYTRDLAELFSDKHEFFLSQDDNARMPIGPPVSKKQYVILLCLEYKVSFPDQELINKTAQTNSICICIMQASKE